MRWSSAAILVAQAVLATAVAGQHPLSGSMAADTLAAAMETPGQVPDPATDPVPRTVGDTLPESAVPPDTLASPPGFPDAEPDSLPSAAGSNGGVVPPAAAGAVHPLGHCNVPGQRRASQAAVGAAFVGTNVQLYRYFKRAWWSGEKADRFFFRADWDDTFRDQDKFGHMLGGYALTRAGDILLQGSCASPKTAIILSAVHAWIFQLQIEIWDGFYEKYGFSYADLLANTVGVGLGVLHAVEPATQVVKPTVSYRRTAALKHRQPWDETRYTTDYSGQTYWFSLDVNAVLPEGARRYWPDIVRFSVGHSITDWLLPAPAGSPEGTPQEVVRARRKILLSLDLDASKLPGNHPAWNFVKDKLSYIRFPAPALQLTPSTRLVRWYR